MTCSRCGSRHPNWSCYVCREPYDEAAVREDHESEMADRERKECLTPPAEESLRAAIAGTPADHPDHEALMSSRFMRKGAA